jgi:hypothetical protein
MIVAAAVITRPVDARARVTGEDASRRRVLGLAGMLERAEDDEDRRRTIVRVHEDYRDAMEGMARSGDRAVPDRPRAALARSARTSWKAGGSLRKRQPCAQPARTRAPTVSAS